MIITSLISTYRTISSQIYAALNKMYSEAQPYFAWAYTVLGLSSSTQLQVKKIPQISKKQIYSGMNNHVVEVVAKKQTDFDEKMTLQSREDLSAFWPVCMVTIITALVLGARMTQSSHNEVSPIISPIVKCALHKELVKKLAKKVSRVVKNVPGSQAINNLVHALNNAVITTTSGLKTLDPFSTQFI